MDNKIIEYLDLETLKWIEEYKKENKKPLVKPKRWYETVSQVLQKKS
tara:strand:- start:19 stop:159 length:141 start_codon:yes stop_codon:yes gene_type:complete